MGDIKVLLLDVDGVLVLPPKLFSEQYCEKYNVDLETQQQFYATQEFKDSSIGKYDLLDAISKHKDMWQWFGDPQELLDMWFEAENYPNHELLKVVEKFRDRGGLVYLATQQEKYRAKYLIDVVFKNKLDGSFVSCELGFNKHDGMFWQLVLKQLAELYPDTTPAQVAYYDDRQNLVELAASYGIKALVYNNADQVDLAISKDSRHHNISKDGGES
jgi:FMN phosphatase YigB (HAD superfamily)